MTNYKLISTDEPISKVRFQPWPETLGNQNIGIERINKSYMESNTDYSNTIEYRYNDYGYRSDESYEKLLNGDGDYIACIGCSNTEGIGIEYEKTWPYLLGKKLGLPVMNLGLTSAGIDYCLYQYYSLVHSSFNIRKPYKIFILQPPYNRFSICNSEEFSFFQDWDFLNEYVTDSNGLYYKLDDREVQIVKSSNANPHTIQYSKFSTYHHSQEFLLTALKSYDSKLETLKWDQWGEDWPYSVDNQHFDDSYQEKIFKEFYKLQTNFI